MWKNYNDQIERIEVHSPKSTFQIISKLEEISIYLKILCNYPYKINKPSNEKKWGRKIGEV